MPHPGFTRPDLCSIRAAAAARAFARRRTGQDHHPAGVTSHRLDGNRTVRNSCGVTGVNEAGTTKTGDTGVLAG